jgi:hypothetical protein
VAGTEWSPVDPPSGRARSRQGDVARRWHAERDHRAARPGVRASGWAWNAPRRDMSGFGSGSAKPSRTDVTADLPNGRRSPARGTAARGGGGGLTVLAPGCGLRGHRRGRRSVHRHLPDDPRRVLRSRTSRDRCARCGVLRRGGRFGCLIWAGIQASFVVPSTTVPEERIQEVRRPDHEDARSAAPCRDHSRTDRRRSIDDRRFDWPDQSTNRLARFIQLSCQLPDGGVGAHPQW